VSVRFLRGNRASHDPLAARALQARVAWRHRPLPTSLRTGKKAVPATRGARSNRGWGEVSAVSNHGGECRGSVFSTPDPVHLRRLPDRKATFDRTRQSSPLLPSGAGCSSGPSRARGNIHLQKSERRTRPGRRSRTASGQRSSRGFRTSMNTCGSCRRRPAATAAPRGPSKGSARRSSPVEGTSSSGRSDALTCSGGNGLTRQGHWARKRRNTRSVTRGVRGLELAKRPPADKAAALSHHPTRKGSSPGVGRGGQSTRSRHCAVKREAAGGRMIARWSGVA
jgi:hypothetical protein